MTDFAHVVCVTLLLFPGLMVSAPDSRLIQSFEKQGDLDSVHAFSARVERVRQHAADGKYAMEIAFAPGGVVELGAAGADWRPFGAATLNVANTSAEPVEFSIEVEDAQGARTRGVTNLSLPAGESGRYALPLDTADPLDMGMRGEPNLPGFRLLKSDHKRVALEHVAVLRIALEKDSAGRMLAIDDVRLVAGVNYDKIIDRFGQYTR
jgi:hypothetical protein